MSFSNLVESATNEHDLQRDSTTTVLSSRDMTYTEKFRSSPSAHEICFSQNTSGSLPLEADAISMESDAEDDRMNAMTSITAKVSFLENQNKVPSFPNSSNNPHYVNPVTVSLERQIPVRSTEIVSNDKVSEDPHMLVNEVVVGDNCMNISTYPAQLNSVETDAVTCDSTVVPEVRQSYSVLSPVCGESTTLEFDETTLPFMQPSHAILWPLPQILQLHYKEEIKKLDEKYNMLHHNVDTAVALKRQELEKQCKIVLMNKVLAEAWIHQLDS